MSEPIEDGIFREINEELRQENFAKLWKQYGSFVIAGALALIIGVGGYQGWHAYDLKSRETQSENYAAAVNAAQAGDVGAALEKLNTLYADGDRGYRLLSAFYNAGLQAKKGDNKAALSAYDRIAGDGDFDNIYRDLARLLAATVEMNTGNGDKDLLTRLQPLVDAANPWRHSARELMALMVERGGDKNKSRDLFKSLSEDASAPQSIRQRAGEMVAALGGQ